MYSTPLYTNVFVVNCCDFCAIDFGHDDSIEKKKQLNKTKQKSIMAATESQSVFNDALVAMAGCEEFEKKTRKKREEKEKKDIDL